MKQALLYILRPGAMQLEATSPEEYEGFNSHKAHIAGELFEGDLLITGQQLDLWIAGLVKLEDLKQEAVAVF